MANIAIHWPRQYGRADGGQPGQGRPQVTAFDFFSVELPKLRPGAMALRLPTVRPRR